MAAEDVGDGLGGVLLQLVDDGGVEVCGDGEVPAVAGLQRCA